MSPLSTTWSSAAPAIGNHLWQSTLFAAAVALLTLTLRNYQARTRYWLWLAASAKFLIPFSLLLTIGSHLAWSVHPATSQPAVYATIDQLSQPFTETTLPTTSTLPEPTHPSTLLPALLATLWLCGFIAVLTYWSIQLRRISKTIRATKPLQTGREIKILRQLEHTANLRSPIELRTSPDTMEPGIFGILHPTLLWPEGISQHLDDAHLEAILAHEVCHVQRRDNLTSTIHMLVEAIFWFHPLVWWLEKNLIDERERACDEAVLQLGKQPQVYAESILKVCEFCIESPLTCVSGITGADLKKRIVQIMTNRLGKNLSRDGKLLLAALGLAAITAPLAFGVVHGMPLYGQILHAVGPTPSFEVATIKLVKNENFSARNNLSPSEFYAAGRTIRDLIEQAYNLPIKSKGRILGAPGWLDANQYQIDAKIEAPLAAAMQTMPKQQRFEKINLMLQSLLADRLNLRVHFETREVPVYALVVAKGGPKLTPAKTVSPTDQPQPLRPQPGDLRKGLLIVPKGGQNFEMFVKGETLDEVANLLTPHPEIGGRTVVNQTGLTGAYDFTMQWEREQGENLQETTPNETGGPGLFTALKNQLGLRLVPAKAPVEVIVIDHIDLPSKN